ncbi:dTDP-4-dehydrorhamnose reductase [Streptomyces abikoensis]|uniref:dTDP-4-dehydrorhamnose reductase n=1 Tax=Streptomyces abikoensis TaxID=97398 RepID=UPI0036BAEADA
MTEPGPRPWLVTGARGMLARDVLTRLAAAGVPAVAACRHELDVTDPESVRAALARHRPAVVVNCAAWTAVDDAERREAEAFAVNATGPRLLAEACRAPGTVLLHVSTDYVFDGRAREPYPKDAPTGPLGAYGRTKLAGERAVLETLPRTGHVVRTAWLYGAGGDSFVRTMIRLAAGRGTVDVVDDQHGQPTWTADLAGLLLRLGGAALEGAAPPGIHHGSAGGHTTWCGLAREVFRLAGADPGRVRPVTGAAFARPAPRPAWSVLGHDPRRAAGLAPLRHWRDALAEAFPELARAAAGVTHEGVGGALCGRCP